MFSKNKRFLGTLFVLTLVWSGFAPTTHARESATTTASKTVKKYDIANPVLFGMTLTDIIPNFGEPRGGGARTHEGLDLMAPEGTPIVSPVKATVVSYGTAPTPGKYVYTKGSDGHLYWYIHLNEIAKLKKGQKLKVGDLIGTVGETGNAEGTTPHLHFEIRKKKPIDPYTRITKEFTLKEKISFLNEAVSDVKNKKKFIKYVITEYGGVLIRAETEGYTLNKEILKALTLWKKSASIASTTPSFGIGVSGKDVRLLQAKLVALNIGAQGRALGENGVTGYFGPLTVSALLEYQEARQIPRTGIFDSITYADMLGL